MILEQMKENFIFAVVRGKTEEDGYEISRAAIQGGVKNIEITFSTPNAESVIKRLIEEYAERNDVVVGAGTVMTTELAQKAIDAGAQFLVSPHLDSDIQKLAMTANNIYMPGCGTATEIVTACRGGAKVIKVFPGGIFGHRFIKDIHGPMPDVNLMPSGGVSLDNIDDWIKAGAWAVGVGSALSATVKDEGYEGVTKMSQLFVDKVSAIKK